MPGAMLSGACPHTSIPDPVVEHFTQKVNHFNHLDKRTFAQRYFVYAQHFRPGNPIFFYTGNEGPIEEFYCNTGLPFDWAEEFSAVVVFAEHRYYGDTLPFGNNSFSNENLGYLSISQALMDFALLASHLKILMHAPKVVAFGGSYGGMLAAWARMRFPDVFDMALAASAPILQAMNLVSDKTTFYRLVTEDAKKADPRCPNAVRAAFAAVLENAETEEGLRRITDTFQLCNTLDRSQLDHFLQYARNAWTEMAMCNYPYPASFLARLPAWPIHVACEKVLQAPDKMAGLAAAVAMPYKAPNATCFDMRSLFVECADQTGCGTGLSARAWDYQMCTEIFYEQATTNQSDMFPPRNWTMERMNGYCQAHYGVSPDPTFTRVNLGGMDVARVASKIIFSNGRLDPWHGGGYLQDQSASLPAVVVEVGAHHLDLRTANPADPEEVVLARQKEKGYIKQWLAEDSLLCQHPGSPSPPAPDIPALDIGDGLRTTAIALLAGLALVGLSLLVIRFVMKRRRLQQGDHEGVALQTSLW